jgi:ATP-dependent exoDNAse (exonuclease V) beta subunit
MIIDAELRKAALNVRESFIVEAPAGSGKTEVLVRRILSLLLEVEHPRNILAITFTRKAAEEMHSRFQQILNARHIEDASKADLVQQVQARIAEKNWAEADLDELNIMTIDALCARILNMEGRFIDPQVAIISDYALLGDALMLALLEHLEHQDEYSAALATVFLYFGNQLEKIKNLLLGILSKRSEWLSVFVSRKDQAVSVAAEMQATLQHLYENLWQKWQSLEPRTWTAEINSWIGLEPKAQQLKKIAQLLLTKQGELRKRFDARLGLAPELKQAYQALVTSLLESEFLETWLIFLREAQALPDLATPPSVLVDALIKILPLTAAHWQVLLREHHYRDFQEEALQALLSLSNTEIVSTALLRFEREVKHILVDEFQDTSRLQFRLLELITQTWQPGDGRTLFLVGDPMQSIYRFRDAKVELFLEAQQQGLGSIKLRPLRLQANFRSDPKIIEFINITLSRAFPKQADILTGAVTFTPSHAEREYNDAPGVETLCFESREQEALALTQKIKALLAADPSAEIAVLARSRNHLTQIMQHLIREQLPLKAERWGNLLTAQVVLDLVSLTCALTHLGDRLAWMALLRSPMVGLNLDELLCIAAASRERTIWEVLSNSEQFSPELAKKIKTLVVTLTPLLFNPHLLLVTRVQQAFLALTQQYQFSDLEKNMLQQYWAFLLTVPMITSRLNFLQELERLKLDYIIDGAQVTLLTIHQAKGLEFDHVFLPHLNQGVRRDDPPLLRWEEFHLEGQFHLLLGLHKNYEGEVDPIYQYLSWLAKEENAHEQVRLLYVALTRAKKGLYLSYFNEPEQIETKAKAGSFFKLIYQT